MKVHFPSWCHSIFRSTDWKLLEAVKGQGMPFKGQPFNFGNLFLLLKAGTFFFHMSYMKMVGNTPFFPIHTNNCSHFFSRRWWFCYWSWQFTRGLVRCLLDVFSLSMLCPYAFCMSNMVNSSNVKSQKKLTTQNWKVLWCWQLICFGDDSYDSCDSYDLWLLWLIFFPCLGRAWKSLGACLDS